MNGIMLINNLRMVTLTTVSDTVMGNETSPEGGGARSLSFLQMTLTLY